MDVQQELIFPIERIVKGQELITVKRDDSLAIAYDLMMDNDIYHLPVVDEQQRLTGILTDKDMKWAIPSPLCDNASAPLTTGKVSEFMTERVHHVTCGDTILDACRIMREHKIGALPVTESDKSMRVVGIVAESDLLDQLAHILQYFESPP